VAFYSFVCNIYFSEISKDDMSSERREEKREVKQQEKLKE